MKTCCIVILSLFAVTSAQLTGGLNPTMGGMGGAGAGMGPGMGAGAEMGGNSQLNNMLMMQFAMADPSSNSLPVMSMLMRNPAMMQNPMGAMMISNLLGVDLHKIAAPLAMANGGSNPMGLMRWLPLMSGDPSAMSLMFSMGGLGGMGPMGGAGMMGAGAGMGMPGMGLGGSFLPFLAAANA